MGSVRRFFEMPWRVFADYLVDVWTEINRRMPTLRWRRRLEITEQGNQASNMAAREVENPNNNIEGNDTNNAEPTLVRCCLPFYNTKTCGFGAECEFLHKARYEMDIISVMPNRESFLGRPRLVQRICKYYQRGHCVHLDNCRFKHGEENDDERRERMCQTPAQDEPANAETNQIYQARLAQIEYLSIAHRVKDINENKNELYNSDGRKNNKNHEPDGKNSEKLEKNGLSDEARNDSDSKKNNKNQEMDEKNKEILQNGTTESNEGACASPPRVIDLDEWVKAPEFIPKSQLRPRSYAEALSPGSGQAVPKDASRKLCPYASKEGVCRNLANCAYLHGEMCDMCERFVLHPYDEEEKKRHRQECLQRHEKDMELSFAIARSKEKTCGVCFEVIMEKGNGEQRFGILPNCNHCFCLTCIRKWRQARQFENKIIRACPECRVTSDFVCPSMYWVDTKEDKDKLIDDYKKALSCKDCKYFKRGEGKCPFGNKCFYLHAFPDGSTCDVGPPPRQRRHRNVENDIDMLQLLDDADEDEELLDIAMELEGSIHEARLFLQSHVPSDDEDSEDEAFANPTEGPLPIGIPPRSYFEDNDDLVRPIPLRGVPASATTLASPGDDVVNVDRYDNDDDVPVEDIAIQSGFVALCGLRPIVHNPDVVSVDVASNLEEVASENMDNVSDMSTASIVEGDIVNSEDIMDSADVTQEDVDNMEEVSSEDLGNISDMSTTSVVESIANIADLTDIPDQMDVAESNGGNDAEEEGSGDDGNIAEDEDASDDGNIADDEDMSDDDVPDEEMGFDDGDDVDDDEMELDVVLRCRSLEEDEEAKRLYEQRFIQLHDENAARCQHLDLPLPIRFGVGDEDPDRYDDLMQLFDVYDSAEDEPFEQFEEFKTKVVYHEDTRML